MGQVLITNVATVTALGNNLEQLWQGLMAGQTGIKPVRHFPVENYISKYAACIEDLIPTAGEPEHSRMRNLLERLLKDIGPVPPDSFLLTATTKAGINDLEQLCRENRVDTKDIILSSIGDIVSQKLGLTEKGINTSASCASSAIATARGAAMIASGKVESGLVGFGWII